MLFLAVVSKIFMDFVQSAVTIPTLKPCICIQSTWICMDVCIIFNCVCVYLPVLQAWGVIGHIWTACACSWSFRETWWDWRTGVGSSNISTSGWNWRCIQKSTFLLHLAGKVEIILLHEFKNIPQLVLLTRQFFNSTKLFKQPLSFWDDTLSIL